MLTANGFNQRELQWPRNAQKQNNGGTIHEHFRTVVGSSAPELHYTYTGHLLLVNLTEPKQILGSIIKNVNQFCGEVVYNG